MLVVKREQTIIRYHLHGNRREKSKKKTTEKLKNYLRAYYMHTKRLILHIVEGI